MKFRLTSLFLITTLVAATIWGIQQHYDIASIKSRFSVIIPRADAHAVVVTTISSRHAVIVVGESAQAHIRLVKSIAVDLSETLAEETLSPGKYTIYLGDVLVTNPADFGFAFEDKSHFINVSRSGGYLYNGVFTVDQSMELTQAREMRSNVCYRVVVDAIQSPASN